MLSDLDLVLFLFSSFFFLNFNTIQRASGDSVWGNSFLTAYWSLAAASNPVKQISAYVATQGENFPLLDVDAMPEA